MIAAALSAVAAVAKAIGLALGLIHDNQERNAGMDAQKVADLSAQVKEANDAAIRDAGVRALGDDAVDSELRRFSRPGDKR